MDINIPEETLMMVKLMKDFVQTECLPLEQELLERDPDWIELPKDKFNDLRGKLKKIGLWALDVPVEYGGAGLDTLTYALLREEQCKCTIGTAHFSPFWGPSGNHIFPVMYRSNDTIKQKFLLPMIRGEKRSALAQTEPDAGADAAAIKTTAVRKNGGWVINGVKRFSTMADRSDFLLVTAVTNPVQDRKERVKSIRMFGVDIGTKGLRVDRRLEVMRPQYSTEVVLEDVFVPEDQMLPGNGFEILGEHLAQLRTLLGMACLGRGYRAIDITVQYTKERRTFGQPLSERQAIQWKMVDSMIELEQAHLLAIDTARKLDQGLDVNLQAAMFKVAATETVFQVLDRCISCMGGVGLTKALPLERWFREMRVIRITDGPTDILKWTIARNLFNGWRP